MISSAAAFNAEFGALVSPLIERRELRFGLNSLFVRCRQIDWILAFSESRTLGALGIDDATPSALVILSCSWSRESVSFWMRSVHP
jgi:hypothetical protein